VPRTPGLFAQARVLAGEAGWRRWRVHGPSIADCTPALPRHLADAACLASERTKGGVGSARAWFVRSGQRGSVLPRAGAWFVRSQEVGAGNSARSRTATCGLLPVPSLRLSRGATAHRSCNQHSPD
jgi:hypothetical protein